MIRLTLLASLVFTSLTSTAQACSCAEPPPPKKSLEAAAAVFSGKVMKVEAAGKFEKAVTLEVVATWKGVEKDKKEVVIRTANDGGACGYEFEKGKVYFIYAYEVKDEKERYLETNICTRTTTIAGAAGDIKELGEGTKRNE